MLGHIFIIPVPLPASENGKRDVGNNSLLGLGTASALGDANAEAVLEALVDVLDVPHAAAAGGLSSLGLLTPVDCSLKKKIHRKPIVLIPSNTHDSNNPNRLTFMCYFEEGGRGVRTLAGLSGRVTAVSTSRLLDVERAAACKSKKITCQPPLILFHCVPCSRLLPALSDRRYSRIRRGSKHFGGSLAKVPIY